MPFSVTVDYISASTNRHPQAADALGCNVAFGSSKLVALWNAGVNSFSQTTTKLTLIRMQDKSDRGVYETLPGHQGIVTCVRFISDGWFVSADDKGVVRSWRNDGVQACSPHMYLGGMRNDMIFAVEIDWGHRSA